MQQFEPIYRSNAAKVPASTRKIILDEGWIDTATNVQEPNTPMEFLFDVYMETVDVSGELDDFTCGQCRQKVLQEWQKLKPFLIELEDGVQN